MLIISEESEQDALLPLDDSIHTWYVIVGFTKEIAGPSQELIVPLRVVRE